MNPWAALVWTSLALLPAPSREGLPKSAAKPGPGKRVESSRAIRVHHDGITSGEIPSGMVLIPEGRARIGISLRSAIELLKREPAFPVDRLLAMVPEREIPLEAVLIDARETENLTARRWLDDAQIAPPAALLELAWNHKEHGRRVEGLDAASLRLPLRGVTGEEAAACAAWLGKRLPTEEEWENAARRGRPADGYYPWGTGWASWDANRCSSSVSSMKGRSGPCALPGGSFPDDRTFDGLLDLCGNVSEWTSSPFSPWPGFDAAALAKELGEKRRLDPGFDDRALSIRGGSGWGNEITNSAVFRMGAAANDRFEAVGFRCALSPIAGKDALAAARRRLARELGGAGRSIDLSPAALAAETIHPSDADGLPLRARHLAFTRVASLEGAAKMRRESVDAPRTIGLLTLSEPAREPALPAGDYVVRFRGQGQPKGKPLAARAKGDGEKRGADADAHAAPPTDRDVLLLVDARGETAAWLPVVAKDGSPATTKLATADDGTTLATRFTAAIPNAARSSALSLAFEIAFASGAYEPIAATEPARRR